MAFLSSFRRGHFLLSPFKAENVPKIGKDQAQLYLNLKKPKSISLDSSGLADL